MSTAGTSEITDDRAAMIRKANQLIRSNCIRDETRYRHQWLIIHGRAAGKLLAPLLVRLTSRDGLVEQQPLASSTSISFGPPELESSYTFNFHPEAAGQLWAAKDAPRPFQFASRRTLPLP
jgi:hypothetical protein